MVLAYLIQFAPFLRIGINYERDHYYTVSGDQTGSTLELVEFYKLQDYENSYKLSFVINCKLYDINGNYAGVIKDGDIVSRVAF